MILVLAGATFGQARLYVKENMLKNTLQKRIIPNPVLRKPAKTRRIP